MKKKNIEERWRVKAVAVAAIEKFHLEEGIIICKLWRRKSKKSKHVFHF